MIHLNCFTKCIVDGDKYFHSMARANLNKSKYSSWLLLPQHQSTYLRGPESASVEIPPTLTSYNFQKLFHNIHITLLLSFLPNHCHFKYLSSWIASVPFHTQKVRKLATILASNSKTKLGNSFHSDARHNVLITCRLSRQQKIKIYAVYPPV